MHLKVCYCIQHQIDVGTKAKITRGGTLWKECKAAKGDEDCTMRDGETSKEGGGLGSEDSIIQAPP